MYSKEQKDIALRIYHQTESVTETIRILGIQHVEICTHGLLRKIPHPKQGKNTL